MGYSEESKRKENQLKLVRDAVEGEEGSEGSQMREREEETASRISSPNRTMEGPDDVGWEEEEG